MGILKQGKDRVLSLFLRQRLNDFLGGAGSAEAYGSISMCTCVVPLP